MLGVRPRVRMYSRDAGHRWLRGLFAGPPAASTTRAPEQPAFISRADTAHRRSRLPARPSAADSGPTPVTERLLPITWRDRARAVVRPPVTRPDRRKDPHDRHHADGHVAPPVRRRQTRRCCPGTAVLIAIGSARALLGRRDDLVSAARAMATATRGDDGCRSSRPTSSARCSTTLPDPCRRCVTLSWTTRHCCRRSSASRRRRDCQTDRRNRRRGESLRGRPPHVRTMAP
jgi:hypothetical protein